MHEVDIGYLSSRHTSTYIDLYGVRSTAMADVSCHFTNFKFSSSKSPNL